MDYRRTYRSAAVSFVDLVSRVPADRLDGPGLGKWTLRDLIGHTVSSALEQVPAVLGTASARGRTSSASTSSGETSDGSPPPPGSGAPAGEPSFLPGSAASSGRSTSLPGAASSPGSPSTFRPAPPTVNVEAPEGYFAFVRDVPPELYAAAVAASDDDARRAADLLTSAGDLAGRATQALAAVADDDVVSTPVGGMRVRDWLPTRTFELVVHGSDVAAAAGVPVAFDPAAVSEATLLAARIAVALGEGPAVLSALTGRTPLPENFSVV
ncbi:maleylpyruvate isomerase N-terminal domain-containing protein [Actinoplanes sp. M2I2]|uniref:maleylpyruvate isomerase N-terminal domain-containing protein n=1 Tax=Actinoplanes sp. M2I2 TaxID=1734444 RepID=UPI002021BABF|nr:maleylpyruvate isomerase N-terminal domain-containing protein [Actinoplanes sp. M2I2]